jgi:hypothetical protein
MIDSLICQAYYNPSLITSLYQLIIGSGGMKRNTNLINDVKASNIYHIKIPKAFIGQTFESLFEYLTKNQNIIPLGLYRLPGCNKNKTPYVVTNPEPNTELTNFDLCFILSQTNPPDTSMNFLTILINSRCRLGCSL